MEPILKTFEPAARGHSFDSILQFGEGNHADVDAILIHGCQPSHHAGIGPRFHPFGKNIGIQQKAHNSTLRRRPRRRLMRTPEPRSGAAARKSARVPLRLVFFAHSSAATITAVVRPFLVMVCGPSDCARLITSLNFAFASATVHSCVFTNISPIWS